MIPYDYFVIANGNSSSQVTALVDNVEEECIAGDFLFKSERSEARTKVDTA